MTKLKNRYAFLLLFAEAGTVVNTSVGYANAYTGDVESFSGANDLSNELKTFYDTELLENARIEMYYAQFAKKQRLPKGRGKTVEWRKWNTFAKAGKLQEAVIPQPQKFGESYKTASIAQYGTFTSVSDVLELRAYDDVILGATEEMGASAGETQESLIRDALYTGTNVLYCANITVATGAEHDTPTRQGGMKFNDTYHCLLTPKMVNRAVTKMKKDRVPRINGKYYAVIHPSVAFDLRESDGWIDAHKYAAPEELFNGEIGELHGCRFIENTYAPILQGADLASDTRTLAVDLQAGYAKGATSIAFDGSTAGVEADALIGRLININGYQYKVTDNTSSAITIASPGLAAAVADNDVIYPGEGAGEGVAAYATYFFGKDAFGIIDPEGGALQMIVKSKEQVGGPLNQFSTIGYKFETNGATILYDERVLRVMSCSDYSADDVAN